MLDPSPASRSTRRPPWLTSDDDRGEYDFVTDGVHAAGFLLALTTALTTALADRYRVERELGQGGMATVYLAEDLRPHRQVALKVVREELRDHDVAVSFVGEAVVRHDVWLVQFPRLPVCDRLRKDSRAAALLDGLSKR